MKPSYITNLMSSFYLWLDHEMLSIGESFTPTSGKLYLVEDKNYAEYNVYSSPFRQWVTDSSISGAHVPSGVYVNGQFTPKGSGVTINYNKGEVLLGKNLGNSLNVTSQYTKKDFNIYYTDEREENILFENAYSLSPKFPTITGGLNGDEQPFPCIFLKNTSYQNVPYALGGQDKTLTTIRCIILADSMYLLDGAISVMTDSARKVFPIIEPSGLPYNYYGDLKNGQDYRYSYITEVQNTNLAYIDRVSVSRLDEVTNKKINFKVVAAMVDFDLWQARDPRRY
jgi:hypothetical protein